MKKNLIHVIYPAQKVISFVLEADFPTQDILEMVFARFNNGSGMECKEFTSAGIRSLSVNDIVCVNGQYFQCLPFGWEEVSGEFVNKLEDEVRNHFRFDFAGAWFALNEIMYQRKSNEQSV